MPRTQHDQSHSGRRLASIREAAEYADCSRDTVRRRIADSTITGYRFGPRLIKVDLNEVDCAFRAIRAGGDDAA